MSSYRDPETLIREWIRDENRAPKVLSLEGGIGYMDLFTVSGRLMQTAAIKFNENLLIAETFPHPNERLNETFTRAACAERFHTRAVDPKLLGRLRAALSPITNRSRPPKRALRNFRQWLPQLPDYMRPFPRVEEISDPVLAARVNNAFDHQGKKTHIIVQFWKNQKDEESWTIKGMYASADDALLDFMKLNRTDDYKLMEIGE